MAAFSTILIGASLGLTAAGTAMQISGAKKKAQADRNVADLQSTNERERERQMELDSTRRKREMIRNSIQARARALSIATAQGSALGSGLQGAYGQIEGQTGENVLGVNQATEIGRNIFANNRGIAANYRSAASAGSMMATGAGLSSLGGAMIKNVDAINRVGTYMFSPSQTGAGVNAGKR